MCGIIGYIGRSAERRQHVADALDALRHRGPDYSGVYETADVAVGHARLSIIDVDGGRQPITDQPSGITIAVNGELYDYRRIMAECVAHGYRQHSHSDSEIIIPLYQRYGLEMMQHLRGEFAFILYDERRHTLIAARDRFGIKPLCWYQDPDRIIIASEAKAIMQCGVEPRLDRYSLMRAASMHYHPTERTLFEGIRQVEPGHMLVVRDGVVKDICYWDVNYPVNDGHAVGDAAPDAMAFDEGQYIERFRSMLFEAIGYRLNADVPVCCHLSGGLDSSAVAGMASELMGRPIDSFSIIFDYADQEYNEHQLAVDTARRCGAKLVTVNVTQDDILDNLSDAVYYSEGLAVNGHLSCKYLLNRTIHDLGYRVALTGEGADECLAGYSHLRQDAYSMLMGGGCTGQTPGMPDGQQEQLIQQLYATNQGIVGVEIPYGDSLDLHRVGDRLGFVPSFLRAKATIGRKVYEVLDRDFRDDCLAHDFYDEMLSHYDIGRQLQRRHPINSSLYLWIKLTLANYILGTLGDGCEMSASIEGRLPFLDHHLFEFARDLPMDLKLRGTVEKYILKEAARPYITDAVYRRQKHPFQSPPVTSYLGPAQTGRLCELFSSHDFRRYGIFDGYKLATLMRQAAKMSVVDQTAYEPVIMLALTCYHLMKRFGL